MQIWGKVIGVMFGFMFGRIPGAILGLVVGHFFDISYSKDFSSQGGFARFFNTKDEFQTEAEFFHCLFSALGHVCKSDGAVTQDDINTASALMDDMGLQGDVRKEAQQAFREGKARDFPLIDMLSQLKENCHARRDILQVYLEILVKAACAKTRLSAPKLSVLEKVARQLDFSKKELHFFVTSFEAEQRFRKGQAQNKQRSESAKRANSANREYHNQRQSSQRSNNSQNSSHTNQSYSSTSYSNLSELEDAYKIIGVSANDDAKTIKKAYKKLMSTHHPDKLASKGLPEQAVLMAKEKAQDIQAAYTLIKKRRDF
ncbi:co-chaperone DjlA [Glaciecola sp. KUL10]|uniref:co-chaperone DjlA n=1 Tax=Glaciecola sp. (strain KUL10) TaxID=2161813 RepID=UPI000D781F8A|nr:co-chaperone DjlA [Glaciecola sp. KUL10]GBL06106.1 Dna-J like membrane chaperone protein [Glaciecola sp. KUL10]